MTNYDKVFGGKKLIEIFFSESKNIMAKANVPLIPGYHGEDQSVSTLMNEADKIGYENSWKFLNYI